MQVALQQSSLVVAQVQSVAVAVAPHLAVGTFAGAGPLPVAEGGELLFPHVDEVVGVDIALVVVAAYAGACRYAAVDEHRAYGDASLAEEGVVAYVELVVAQKSLAAVGGTNMALLAREPDEVEQLAEVLWRQPQHGVGGTSPYGEDGEQTPQPHTFADEIPAQGWQLADVLLRDACHHVEDDALLCHEHVEGAVYAVEALLHAAHPVVVVLQSVEAYRHRAQSCLQQALEALLGECQSVGDDAPWESALVEGASALFQVGAHEGFAAGDDDEHVVRVVLCGDAVEHAEEIFHGHVGCVGHGGAVAATVPTAQVAAQGTFPEELVEGMLLDEVALKLTLYLQSDTFAQAEACVHRVGWLFLC